jgi:hypothetical protein
MNRFLPALPIFFGVGNLLAQDSSPADEAVARTAGLIGGTCGCIGGLIGLAIWIFLVVYVYRDAKARGMENAVLLTILTAFTGILGFIIYLVMRPKNKITPQP